jgi:hypothetical protein
METPVVCSDRCRAQCPDVWPGMGIATGRPVTSSRCPSKSRNSRTRSHE